MQGDCCDDCAGYRFCLRQRSRSDSDSDSEATTIGGDSDNDEPSGTDRQCCVDNGLSCSSSCCSTNGGGRCVGDSDLRCKGGSRGKTDRRCQRRQRPRRVVAYLRGGLCALVAFEEEEEDCDNDCDVSERYVELIGQRGGGIGDAKAGGSRVRRRVESSIVRNGDAHGTRDDDEDYNDRNVEYADDHRKGGVNNDGREDGHDRHRRSDAARCACDRRCSSGASGRDGGADQSEVRGRTYVSLFVLSSSKGGGGEAIFY